MDGWPALSIHGDKSQQERDWVLSEFKQNKSPIMLATDVAARGLGMLEHPVTLHLPANTPCTCLLLDASALLLVHKPADQSMLLSMLYVLSIIATA